MLFTSAAFYREHQNTLKNLLRKLNANLQDKTQVCKIN